jgi:hypothetical protein
MHALFLPLLCHVRPTELKHELSGCVLLTASGECTPTCQARTEASCGARGHLRTRPSVGPGACADSGSSGLLFNTAVDQSEAASSESGRRRHEEAKQAHMARAESGDNSAAGGAGVYLVFRYFQAQISLDRKHTGSGTPGTNFSQPQVPSRIERSEAH